MEAVQREWAHAVDSVRRAAEHAQARGVMLAVEPINRYETFLVNTCDQGLRFIQEVDYPAVGLHLDTFHTSIEETDPIEAVRQAAGALINVHIADSNRQSVGRGHADFRGLVRALLETGYPGSLALEPLPPAPDPFIVVRLKRDMSLRDAFAEESITRLRPFEAKVRGSEE